MPPFAWRWRETSHPSKGVARQRYTIWERSGLRNATKTGAFTDRGGYRDLVEQALKSVGEAAVRYPTAFARLLSAADFALGNVKQVAVLGDAQEMNLETLIQVVRSEYRPNIVVASSKHPPQKDSPSLLDNRPLVNDQATAYVCEDFVCQLLHKQRTRRQLS